MRSSENNNYSKRRRTAVLVLGMHRSGTSSVTRIINLHGVPISQNLEPANEFNEKGYWESKEIMDIHDRLLSHAGSSWKDCSDFPQSWLDSGMAQPYREDLVATLRRDFNDSSLFLIKDPRICRLMPLWLQILEDLDAKPAIVIPFRNPAEVAQSLNRRDALHQQRSLAVWLRHVLDAEKHSRGMPRSFIDFQSLLEDWQTAIERMQANLELAFPLPSETVYSQVENELSANLKHYTTSKARIGKSVVSTLATRAYESLQQLALGENEELIQIFDDIAREFQPIAESLGPILVDQDSQLIDAQQKASVAAQQIRELASQLDLEQLGNKNLASERDALRSENEDLINRFTDLELRYRLRGMEQEKLAAEYLALEDDQATLEHEFAALKTDKASIDSALEHTQSINNQIMEEQNRLESQLQSVYKSTSWRISLPIRILKRILVSTYSLFRRAVSFMLRLTWKLLPLSKYRKTNLKSRLFARYPKLFKNTVAYQAWQRMANKDLSNSQSDQQKKNSIARLPDQAIFIPRRTSPTPINPPVKLIAFYLPQFHTIPENDEWWGKGFTEWTNVKPAQPQFEGHFQPRIPSDLGYYDLRNKETQRKQVDLAKLYGIGGFCFYFYWFHGERLLESPVKQYLDSKDLDLPFCLCWANENWSRRWDGRDHEILIGQEHSPADDIAFIEHLSEYLRDERYIRVEGKPLILVYRPSLLPKAKNTARRWRKWCRENNIGEIYLAYTQSFENADPASYGFDAAIEFPPNNSAPPRVTENIKPIRHEFSGTVYDWSTFVERSQKYTAPDYQLFRSVCPSWDNTARRKHNGTIFVNNTPAGYRQWLENAIEDTVERIEEPNDRLIFINAWNEWAEGAYLEPDSRYGYAYLQSTLDALENCKVADHSVLLVSHDAHPHGAQFLVLNMATQLRAINCQVHILVLGEGELLQEYEKVAETKLYTGNGQTQDLTSYLQTLRYSKGVSSAVINSVASGHVAKAINQAGFSSLGLVHELPQIIRSMGLESSAQDLASYTDRLIFPANFVLNSFREVVDTPFKATISPQGLYKKNSIIRNKSKDECRQLLREQYQLAADCEIVLGVGGGDFRKGLDLFIEIAERVAELNPQIYFIWAGKLLDEIKDKVDDLLARSNHSDNIILTDSWVDTDIYYAGSDLYALTSREDPFPSVVLESFDASIPVLAFDGCGGFVDIVSNDTGGLVPAFDLDAYSASILKILGNPSLRNTLSVNVTEIARNQFSFYKYVFDVLNYAGQKLPKVSVILPNYNYADLIATRIDDICSQDFPIYELIILDDASTDESVQVIKDKIKDLDIPIKLLINNTNSGSVFKQWLAGVEQASGDLIWIAEADDLADDAFLSTTIKAFEEDSDTSIAYCQSKQISGDGQILAQDYLAYTRDISEHKWRSDYQNQGLREIAEALSVKNTIPNVSAVLFNATALNQVLSDLKEELPKYKVAGDWLVYLNILKLGNLCYVAKALNSHRRHEASVTAELDAVRHLREVRELQIKAQSLVPPEQTIVEQADKYMSELFDYFGVKISLDELESSEVKQGASNL